MSWSGTSPLAVVRGGMWGLLLFAGVAWLAIGWSVLRLEPADVVHAAGPVVLFGAATEGLRACAGTRTWWLNASMCALFLLTGVVLLAEQDSSYTTPAALVGWYLMVRGALDVAVAVLTRDTDRVWGLLMVVGVLEAGLGFFAAGPLLRDAGLMVAVLGAVGTLRGIADVVTGLRLREARPAARTDLLELTPERALGLTGYTAGITDYDSAPARTKARHRAQPGAAGKLSTPTGAPAETAGGGPMWPAGRVAGTTRSSGGTAADAAAGGVTAAGGMAAAGYVAADGPGPAADTFHEEVLRTTADLDAMLALAGVTGAGVGAQLPDHDMPSAPDTPEGVETAGGASPPAEPTGEDQPAGEELRAAAEAGDGGPPILDPTADAATEATSARDDTAMTAGSMRRPD
jgi:hypothetical protein